MARKQNVRILRMVMIPIAVISFIVFPPWKLVWAWLRPLPDTVQEEVENALDHDFDGIIVYVNQAGKPPAFYAAGWHDRKKKIPAYPKALFKIASISKLYVAVATAKLIHARRLSLDQSLAEYLPELVGRIEYAEAISLRMMIQHRSGIPNLTDTPGFWENPPKNSTEALERVLDMPARFAPDTDYEYCNTNYLLLAEIMDKVLGYSHQQYIKDEVLRPLGLEHTFFSIHEVDMDQVMSGYYVGIEEDIKTTDYGSMVATAEDVGIFLRALNEGSVFEEGEQEIYSSLYVYNHTGLIPGYQSIAKYHPDLDAVVVQFVNTTDFSDYQHWGISEAVYKRVVKMLKNTTR